MKDKDTQVVTNGFLFNVNIDNTLNKDITLRFSTNFNSELKLYNLQKHVAILLFFAILIIAISIFNYYFPANFSFFQKKSVK